MHFFKLFIPSFFAIVFLGCNNIDKTKFAIKMAKEVKLNDEVAIEIENKTNVRIDSVSYSIGATPLQIRNKKVKLNNVLLGKQEVKAKVYFKNSSKELSKKITVLSDKAPKLFRYEIINTYPHDIKAYTQGLEFIGDTLYENTGKKGESSLRKVNYTNGEVLSKINLSNAYFGEGITILNNKIYQLTWQSGKGFIYDLNTFKNIGSFAYGESKEGWGLCNDGKKIYKSDGTERIWILNPETLIEESYIQTATNTAIFSKANELEYVNGKIYANSYLKDGVMIINPDNGAIEGVVDFRGLKKEVTQHGDLDVLNGIAYHKQRQTFFVTGKYWDKLFEVKIIEK